MNTKRFLASMLSFMLLLSIFSGAGGTSFAEDSPDSLLNDGWRYFQGDGVQQDIPKGISMIKEAAAGGSTDAMLRLGYLCAYGSGFLIEDNYEEGSDPALALKWFSKVADAGETETAAYAIIDVGYDYLIGGDESIPEDTAASVMFFQKAEELGVYAANNILGIFYTYGAVVDRDPEKALELFVEGAKAGYTDCEKAIEEYAYAYYAGTDADISVNFETAFKYYEALTEFDNTRAMYNLGLLYIYGLGVSLDRDKGIEWITKAANMGDEVAIAMLEMV